MTEDDETETASDRVAADGSAVRTDPTTETYRAEIDWTRTAPVTAAVTAVVAETADADPGALPPLFERLDPDALDRLFDPTGDHDRAEGRLTVPYAGYEVTVHAGGEVTLERRETTETGRQS